LTNGKAEVFVTSLLLFVMCSHPLNQLINQPIKYSQTCVKQPHKGSTKSGCLGQVAANNSGEYQYKIYIWEHFD